MSETNFYFNDNNYYSFESYKALESINKKNDNLQNKNKYKILFDCFNIINNLFIFEQNKNISSNYFNPIFNPLLSYYEKKIFSDEQIQNNNEYICESLKSISKNEEKDFSLINKDNEFLNIFPQMKKYFEKEKEERKLTIQINKRVNLIKSKSKSNSPKNKIQKSQNKIANKKHNNNITNILYQKNNQSPIKKQIGNINLRKCISPNSRYYNDNKSNNVINKNEELYKLKENSIIRDINNNSTKPNSMFSDDSNMKGNNNKINNKFISKGLYDNNKQKIIKVSPKNKKESKFIPNKKLLSKNPLNNNINQEEIMKKEIKQKTNKVNNNIKSNLSFSKSNVNLKKNLFQSPKKSKYSARNNNLNKSYDITTTNEIFEIFQNTQILDSSYLKNYDYDKEVLKFEENKIENEKNEDKVSDRFSFKQIFS